MMNQIAILINPETDPPKYIQLLYEEWFSWGGRVVECIGVKGIMAKEGLNLGVPGRKRERERIYHLARLQLPLLLPRN